MRNSLGPGLLLAALLLWGQAPVWQAGIARVIPRADLNRRPGTAFVVALRGGSAFLVTSAHVVAGDPSPTIEFVADPENPVPATVRHLEASDERGLAILVVGKPPTGVRATQESGPPGLAIGERVTVAGFPAPIDRFTAVDTTIATVQGRDLLLSRETGEGFSGGPVLRDGAVVGLVYGRDNFGKAVGSASIRQYVEGHGLSWERGVEPSAPAAPQPGAIRTNPNDGQPYVWIPPGEFQIGCSPGDNECDGGDENPPPTVRITRGFWLGQTEVTVGAYKRFAAKANVSLPAEPVLASTNKLNPGWTDLEQPMVMIAWEEAKSYCESWAKGRLPTEAEWEYAARAGSKVARYGDLNVVAWHGGNSGNRIHRVKQWQANPWGPYDMLGNVREWVADWYEHYSGASPAIDPRGPAQGRFRVLRGGSWDFSPRYARASGRITVVPGLRDLVIGVRCAWE